jgi:hypothetical protein
MGRDGRRGIMTWYRHLGAADAGRPGHRAPQLFLCTHFAGLALRLPLLAGCFDASSAMAVTEITFVESALRLLRPHPHASVCAYVGCKTSCRCHIGNRSLTVARKPGSTGRCPAARADRVVVGHEGWRTRPRTHLAACLRPLGASCPLPGQPWRDSRNMTVGRAGGGTKQEQQRDDD